VQRAGCPSGDDRVLFSAGRGHADNFLSVYPRAEIGYDTPEHIPGRVRPGKLARRLILALIIGVLAGAAIMLQIRGWTTLGSEAGGACGTSDQGVSYGACPRGITPALIISIFIGIVAVPAAIAMLLRKGWARRGAVAIGLAGGVLAGQALFGIWHGTDLTVAWVAPSDSSSQLTTVGAWASGNAATGALAVAAGTAIVLTDDGVAGMSAATGAQRWTLASPDNCSFQQLAASGDSVVALAACDGSYHIVSIDPTAGQAAWHYHVTEPSDSYQFQILSASPVVINDDLTGPRGTSTVREFGPNGAETLTFNVSGIPLGGGTVDLNTASTGGFGVPVAVADGMLVGATTPGSSGTDAIVGYRLADGRRQWLVDTPDEVNDAALSGGELVFVDESDPAYSLEEVNASTGTLRSLGYFTQGILQSGQSGLYPFRADDVVVNTTGDSGDQPPVAAIRVPAAQG
jgi:hypothetical protein